MVCVVSHIRFVRSVSDRAYQMFQTNLTSHLTTRNSETILYILYVPQIIVIVIYCKFCLKRVRYQQQKLSYFYGVSCM